MGVLQDQIAAIRANAALSDDEKRAQIYAVKCNGLFDYIGYVDESPEKVARYLGKTFTYNGVNITVHAVGVSVDEPKRLVLDLELTKNSITRRDTYYVTNPPVLDSTGNENLLQVVGEMLSSWANW